MQMKYVRRAVGPLFVLTIMVAALWLLYTQLHRYHLRDILESLRAIPPARFFLAAILTVANYLVLVGYDWIGLRYIGHAMRPGRIVLAAFLGYAVGNNFGTLIGGSTIRVRLYTSWGLSAEEIVKLVLMLSLTFWIGLFALASAVFVLDPLPIPDSLHMPFVSTTLLGVVLGGVAAGYLLLCATGRKELAFGRWRFHLPPWRLALLQFAIAGLDLIIASGVLYLLLPDSLTVSFQHFLAVYLLALIAALISQVPAGIGVMELAVLVMLGTSEPQRVMAAMLAYRLTYYLIPLGVGVLVLGWHELALSQRHIAPIGQAISRVANIIVPRVVTTIVFLGGIVLLVSGATPAAHGRIHVLREIVPLPLVEVSHLLGSIVGLALIVLARSLLHRVETAYYAVVGLLFSGVVLSLLKGLDYEEAIFLAVILILFLPTHQYFYRKGALFSNWLSVRWFVTVVVVMVCTAWLMFFAYRHVEYRNELWWQFAWDANAPRSLRAMALVTIAALLVSLDSLLRARHRAPALPTQEELEVARQIVASSPRTYANLALLGDKHLLFNAEKTGFVMYGVEGRSWIAMGDPVGDADVQRELAWNFAELCDEGGHWTVFYQVDGDNLPTYVDIGLTLIKIGEEARVPLADFNLQGSHRKGLRRTVRKLTEAGCSFEIVQPPLSDSILANLRDISDAWLANKNTAEKGFSLGFFQPDYIRRCPVAIVRQGSEAIAFANLWLGAGKEELSIDLMRYRPESVDGIMEYLFTELMVWGAAEGYQWFNLGMAPLSGIDSQRSGPAWNRIAKLTYRHGEHFYNFRGLRQYKEKFHPVWTPKYLASPGGFALPVILTNLATLISGGLRKIFSK